MKFFVAVITKQVVERHLVAPLADMLSPVVMARYTDQEIRYLAAEAPRSAQLREHLEGKLKMLREGQDAFCAAVGAFD
jgi:hypothetical protein